MGRLAIFIDGGYVDALCRDEFRGAAIHYGRLAEEVTRLINDRTAEPLDLFRSFYYHCPPYQSNPPTPAESTRYAQFRKFETALTSLPRFAVRLGRLQNSGQRADGSPIFVQKQVDLLLGIDIALLSAKQTINQVALVAGDSDLLPAVQVAKEEGVSVWLFHGPGQRSNKRSTYSRDLWQAVDDRYEIDATFVSNIARPARLEVPPTAT